NPGERRIYEISFTPLLPDHPGCKYATLKVNATGPRQTVVAQADLDGVAVLTSASISAEIALAKNSISSMNFPAGSPMITSLLPMLDQINAKTTTGHYNAAVN